MFFASLLFTKPLLFFLTALAVIPSICLHEYFHAQTALWCGDPTAARTGHLTLNPLKQMGVISLFMFLILGIAWGGVPVNPFNLTKKGRVLTALAGPLLNLTLFLLAFFSYPLVALIPSVPTLLVLYLYLLGTYNLILFLFNLMPIPGLDGWNVLNQFVKIRELKSEWFKGIMIFLIFVLLMVFPKLTRFASWVMELPVMLFGGN